LRRVTAGGLVRYTVASFKPKYLLDAWVEHLALLAGAPAGVAPQTRLVTKDRTWLFGEVSDPHDTLASLVQLYAEGRREPLPFFPASSYEWVANAADPDKAWRKAADAWQGSEFLSRIGLLCESEDPANRIAWGHRDDPFAPRFAALAEAVYGPLLAAVQKARSS
jgi:exodeoxyribonuclease V gamma subunit